MLAETKQTLDKFTLKLNVASTAGSSAQLPQQSKSSRNSAKEALNILGSKKASAESKISFGEPEPSRRDSVKLALAEISHSAAPKSTISFQDSESIPSPSSIQLPRSHDDWDAKSNRAIDGPLLKTSYDEASSQAGILK